MPNRFALFLPIYFFTQGEKVNYSQKLSVLLTKNDRKQAITVISSRISGKISGLRILIF
jgi:hypothetical protein